MSHFRFDSATQYAEDFFLSVGKKYEDCYAIRSGRQDKVNLYSSRVFGFGDNGDRYMISEDASRLVLVHKDGSFAKVFDLRAGLSDETHLCQPCLDPEGNVIYIESSMEGHKIIRINKSNFK